MLGGPIGAVIGVVLGSLFEGTTVDFGSMLGDENGEAQTTQTESSSSQRASAGDIKIALLVLIAWIIRFIEILELCRSTIPEFKSMKLMRFLLARKSLFI